MTGMDNMCNGVVFILCVVFLTVVVIVLYCLSATGKSECNGAFLGGILATVRRRNISISQPTLPRTARLSRSIFIIRKKNSFPRKQN